MGKPGTLIGVAVIVLVVFGVGYLIFFGGAPQEPAAGDQGGTKLAVAPGGKGSPPAEPGAKEPGERTERAAEETSSPPAGHGAGAAPISPNEVTKSVQFPPPPETPSSTETPSPGETSPDSSKGGKALGAVTAAGTAAVLSRQPEGGAPAAVAEPRALSGEEPTRPAGRTGTSSESAVALTPGTAKLDEASPRWSTYEVKKGDTCWSIAVIMLGDGKRWKEIRDLNPGVRKDGTGLNPGEIIKVPLPEETAPEAPAATVPPAAPETPSEEPSYTIKEGDTLEGISKRFYDDGSVRTWKEILAANPGLDPDILPAGKKIRLPVINGKKPAAPAPEAKPEDTEQPRADTQVRSP